MTIRRRFRAWWPTWLLGLRPRLVVVVLLVALGSGLATAGISYVSARNALLESAQDDVMDDFLDTVREVAVRSPRLDADAGASFATALGEWYAVFMREGGELRPLHIYDGPSGEIPQELLDAVGQGGWVYFQRAREDGPFLYVGTAVLVEGEPSGLEVYQRFPQHSQELSLKELEKGAMRALAGAGAAAVVLALMAAGSVLRPVRALSRGAERLGAGALDTRLPVRGSDELSRLVMSFNSAAAQLEHSVDQLRREERNSRRFVADVSHELRTPLAAMVAVTETLDSEAARLGEDGATAARLLSVEVARLAELVENLIEISRFDAGQATLVPADVDLAEVVRGALRARGWLDQVDVTTRAAADQATVMVWADPRRLDVIIANLVGNAFVHGAPPVTVTVFQADGSAGVEVRDSGAGMAADAAGHVFERFYKADRARLRSEGSGLGLAIAWENARLHGGKITVSTAPGAGMTFTVLIPNVLTRENGEWV